MGHVAATTSSDDILKKFWETEEIAELSTALTPEEQSVFKHYKHNHVYLSTGQYQVSLPKKTDPPPMGESRSQAVRHFFSNEQSIIRKGSCKSFQAVVEEYLMLGHAEPVPAEDLTIPSDSVCYLPMHAVIKDSSSTTKLHVVLDASAKSTARHSLNDSLLVGPTLYPNLFDLLVRFRSYQVAVSSDIKRFTEQ